MSNYFFMSDLTYFFSITNMYEKIRMHKLEVDQSIILNISFPSIYLSVYL